VSQDISYDDGERPVDAIYALTAETTNSRGNAYILREKQMGCDGEEPRTGRMLPVRCSGVVRARR